VVDLDDDGFRDVITGSWPGELYWFRGRSDGDFEKAATIPGPGGNEINLGNASTVFAADWEGDGDLDLLVGDIDGFVHLVLNASGGKALAYGAAQHVRVGGRRFKVDGDSGPILADWDGDGRKDLVVGSGEGRVVWCRDLAKEGEPLFGPVKELVANSTLWSHERKPRAKTPWGVRTKPCVADWDGDGKADLLVGDFNSEETPEPTLTPEQQKRRDEIKTEMAQLSEQRMERWKKASLAVAKEQGRPIVDGEPQPPSEGKEQQRWFEAVQARIEADDPGWSDAMMERQQELWEELSPMQAQNQPHGHVWLFRRR
jgi:hypothetical protein